MGYLNDIRKQEAIKSEIRYTRDNFNGSGTSRTLRYIEAMNQYKYSTDITFYFDSLEELDKDGYARVRKMLAMESLSNMSVINHPVCNDDNIDELTKGMMEDSDSTTDSSSSLKDLINKMKGDR